MVINDFRGQEWTFVRVTRLPEPGKSGKVLVRDEFDRPMEFYWTVFPDTDFASISQEA